MVPRRGTEVSYRTWHTLHTLFVGRIGGPSGARTVCGRGVSQRVVSIRGSRSEGRCAAPESSPRGCRHPPTVVNDAGIPPGKFALEAKLWIGVGAVAPTLVNLGFARSCGACGAFWKGNHKGDALEVDGHLAPHLLTLRRRCSGSSSEILVRMLGNIEDATRLRRRFASLAHVIVGLETVLSQPPTTSCRCHFRHHNTGRCREDRMPANLGIPDEGLLVTAPEMANMISQVRNQLTTKDCFMFGPSQSCLHQVWPTLVGVRDQSQHICGLEAYKEMLRRRRAEESLGLQRPFDQAEQM